MWRLPHERGISPALVATALILASGLLLASPAHAERVTGLMVYHTAGQTFLTWRGAGKDVQHYTVYRSRSSLRTALALGKAEQIFTVRPGASNDRRMSAILGYPVYHRFPGPAGQLGPGVECFVVTTAQSGSWFYAVTATTRRGEERVVRPGGNATASAVRERTATPRPIRWAQLQYEGRQVEVFTHWASNVDAPGYPAMVNVPSYPFHFAVRKRGRSGAHPLLVRLHGRGDHFLGNLNGTGHPQEYVLALDDELPGLTRGTFWFGYNLGVDIHGAVTPAPSGGVVLDYTQRRVLWTVEWALRSLPLDPSRVYVSGTSMGGSGAVFLSQTFPRLFAAGLALIPRLRYAVRDSADTPRGKGTMHAFDALWGNPRGNPLMLDGSRVYDVLDAVQQFRRSAETPLRIVAGSRDAVVGWKQLAATLRAADSLHRGLVAFWDDRDHDTHGRHYWTTQQDGWELYRYRRERSWPSFSNVSEGQWPADSSRRGMMNAGIEWFEPLVDLPTLWSVGVRRCSVQSGEGVLATPGTITATISPRRVQRFPLRAGQSYECRLLEGERVVYTATARCAREGELNVPAVPVGWYPLRFEIRPILAP